MSRRATPGAVTIGRLTIKADRWPWQLRSPNWADAVGPGSKGPTWGWGKVSGMGRFGGGWDWKLGLSISGCEMILDLLFGSLRFHLAKKEVSK